MAGGGKRRRSQAQEPGDLVSFGKRLKEYRIAQRLTQEDLAGSHYSAAYISHLEAGKREPSDRALGYLATRLGIGMEELWSGRVLNWAMDMAEDFRNKGMPREAYALLERTLTNLERDGQVSSQVLSVMHRELGLSEQNPVVAEKHLREAVELALQNEGPVVDTAQSLAALGDVLADQGNLDEGLKAYRQATELLLDRFPRRNR